jgi:cytochrome c biogenesis protein
MSEQTATETEAETEAPDGVVSHLEEAGRLTTQPRAERGINLPRLGSLGMLRWMWRQLTSMRIALILLFLLSLAAIPGSLLPQREIDPAKVDQFFIAHPGWAPFLDRLELFDVFESVWFGAIYTLLFISLVGCIVPRSFAHFKAMRAAPVAAPRNLRRLPVHASFTTAASADDALAAARARLRKRRFRTSAGSGAGGRWISAEKGYLRESGNLLFHLSLVGLLIAVAIGHFFGFKGAVLVTQGSGFSDTVAGYDSLTMGQLVGPSDLPPFQISLNNFSATYETAEAQYGAPRTFNAYVTYKSTPTSKAVNDDLQVNEPITVNGTRIYLESHGYAPVVTVRDGKGDVVFDGPVVFLEQNAMFTSSGAIKAPDAQPQGLGFQGFFLPDEAQLDGSMPFSDFPAADHPMLILNAYAGNLNMNGGEDQNVYTLDTSQMKQLQLKSPNAPAGDANAMMLNLHQTQKLPNGLGSITFDGVDQWVQFNTAYDPGQSMALVCAVLAILGLIGSLGIRRRRIWVRVTARPDGTALVEVAGLARTEGATPTAEVTATAETLAQRLGVTDPAEADKEAQTERDAQTEQSEEIDQDADEADAQPTATTARINNDEQTDEQTDDALAGRPTE